MRNKALTCAINIAEGDTHPAAFEFKDALCNDDVMPKRLLNMFPIERELN